MLKLISDRFKITALLIVVIFLGIFFFRFEAGITGAAITGATVLTHIQGANFDVDANAGASLTLVNLPAGSTLTFFRVAGLLEGDGSARVYVVADGGTKYLVANEDTILASARNLVTGYAVKENNGNQGGGQGNGNGGSSQDSNAGAQAQDAGGGGNGGNNGNGNGGENNPGGGNDGNNGNGNNNQGQGNSDNENGNKQNRGEERWHHTPKPNPQASLYAVIDEKKEAEQKRQKYNFELTCDDSCELPAGSFTSKEVKLLFEVSNARLKINNVQYGFAPYAVAPPEPEEPPVTNTTPPETNITPPPEQPPATNATNETQVTPATEIQTGGSQVSFSSGSPTSDSPVTAAAIGVPVETPSNALQASVSSSPPQEEGQQGSQQEGTSQVVVRQNTAPTSLTGAIPVALEQVDRQSAIMLLVDVVVGGLIIWQFFVGVGWRKLKRKLRF